MLTETETFETGHGRCQRKRKPLSVSRNAPMTYYALVKDSTVSELEVFSLTRALFGNEWKNSLFI
jgi:hypothetical protein